MTGLIAAVLTAVVPVVQASVGSIEWSTAGLQALGYALLTPAISAALSYIGRFTHPPR